MINWRLVDERELYTWDDLVTHTSPDYIQRHSQPSREVERYLKDEETLCLERQASKKVKGSSSRLPPCPCISPDLRTYTRCFIKRGLLFSFLIYSDDDQFTLNFY